MRLVLTLALFLWGCEGLRTADIRYSTPEHTVQTLFSAYGMELSGEEELRARMARQEPFPLEDRALHASCFSDFDGTSASEGLAGWVFGVLAAGREHQRVEIVGQQATVSPREGIRVVLHPDSHGAWKISLRESVPPEVRRALFAVAERAEDRVRRTGTLTQKAP
jgi:hypothetical protein